MSARFDDFPWPSHYGNFNFFEQRIGTHKRTVALEREEPGIYILTRNDGIKIRTFVCECYAYGVAEYTETTEKIGTINAIIINSAWCGYSADAKFHCRDLKVGLFKIGEFMGALHRSDYWNYLTEFETEYYQKLGW